MSGSEPAAVNVPTEDELADAIARAARTAIAALRERHPESFYYVTLYTSGEAHPPSLSAWSREALARVREAKGAAFAELVRWSYADSPYCDFGAGAFDDVRRLFDRRPEISSLDDAAREAEYGLRLRAMEAALARLDAVGFFGTGAARLAVFVNAEVMPPDAGNTERARRLNPPGALESWLREVAE